MKNVVILDSMRTMCNLFEVNLNVPFCNKYFSVGMVKEDSGWAQILSLALFLLSSD